MERVAPTGEVHVDRRLITIPFEKEELRADFPMLLELQSPGNPQRVKLTLDPNGQANVSPGIIECDESRLRLCFGQCVGKDKVPDETSRPVVFIARKSGGHLELLIETQNCI